MKKTIAIAVTALALGTLAGCSNADPEIESTPTASNGSGFDLSTVQKDDKLAAEVPAKIAESGKLSVGTSADYEPAEYIDLATNQPAGFDIDIMSALAAKLGLKAEYTNAPFDSILPAVGNKYNAAISSFSITPERTQQVNMVSYMKSGSLFMVKADNDGFKTDDLCGKTLGAQSGTSQQTYLEDASAKCTADGKAAISLKPESDAQMLTTKLGGGQLDAIMVDNIAAAFTSKKHPNEFKTVGDVIDSDDAGIVVAKNDEQLAKVIQAGVQALIDDGTIDKILASWDVAPSSAIKTSKLN
ncbi:hypothetical protein BK816_05360 [Boudabousia tangfeifanii]|uniref:Solute-binding protein family 3/N-terminal domain-containing protein n=1 Tax=Boudabousia tangfeifanii TaxID=1912795 RepID=A0A1D9MKI9_9ACTO|nr:ABC transporter substrate-binding protein [Boudabousia tangfeifanii]AOZ72792.1 hypothetical protein BK816_05360 [Boudabousia tangfeifanii]